MKAPIPKGKSRKKAIADEIPLSDVVPKADEYLKDCLGENLDDMDPDQFLTFCKVMVSSAAKALKLDKVAIVHLMNRSQERLLALANVAKQSQSVLGGGRIIDVMVLETNISTI